jgi:hypothetical protein
MRRSSLYTSPQLVGDTVLSRYCRRMPLEYLHGEGVVRRGIERRQGGEMTRTGLRSKIDEL